MVALIQCFNGSGRPRRNRAHSQNRQNWLQGAFQTIKGLITGKKTRPRDEEQGLMPVPSIQQQSIHAYGTFYAHDNSQLNPAALQEALHDPNIHLGELRELFPGFDGTSIAPITSTVSIATPSSVRTGHPMRGSSAVSPLASSVYSATSADSPRVRLQPTAESFASEYVVVKTLKRNNQGPVHLVERKSTGVKFVIKQMRYLTIHGRREDPDELYMMKKINKHNHRNIIQLEDVVDDRNRGISNMVLEFCSAGDVDNLISACRSRGEHPPTAVVLSIAAALIDATAFLHFGDVGYDPNTHTAIGCNRPGIAHMDIKPGNVFLRWPSTDNDNYGLPEAVLADMGLACPIPAEHTDNRSWAGTPGYRAPERICSAKSDMYSLGVTLFQLITSFVYKPEYDNIATDFANSSVRDHPRFLRLLETCLSPDPNDRPAANELHRTSYIFKKHVKEWFENGGRVPADFWPVPFANDEYLAGQEPQSQPQQPREPASSPPHYSQISSPLSPNAPSMTDAIADHPALRRRAGQADLQAIAGAEYAQELADIPDPFRPLSSSGGAEVGLFPTGESEQAAAGAQAPHSCFSWGSDDGA